MSDQILYEVEQLNRNITAIGSAINTGAIEVVKATQEVSALREAVKVRIDGLDEKLDRVLELLNGNND